MIRKTSLNTDFCKVAILGVSLWLPNTFTRLNLKFAGIFLFNRSVMSDSLWPHGHKRLPCPPLSPGVYSHSCPLSLWCYLTISSSAAPSPLPSVFPSIRVFSSESILLIRSPKYWNFSFSISPFNEYSGLISFNGLVWSPSSPRDAQESLQHDSSKALILWCSAFIFMVQLSYLYMTTGKNTALTTWTFVSKVMSLLVNMLCHSFSL